MSRTILILSRKIIKPAEGFTSRVQLTEYVNNLSELAKSRNGFIKSDSYWNQSINNNDFSEAIETISISEWKNMESWNSWKNSTERNRLNNQYKNILESEKFSILQKKTPTDDIFLL